MWSRVITNGQAQVGLRTSDSLSWWTINSFIEIPDGQDENGNITYAQPEVVPNISAKKISLFGNDMCYITEREVLIPGTVNYEIQKSLKCYAEQDFYTEVIEPIDLSSSEFFGCAINNDGVIFCWGENSSGQLGTGDLENKERPTRVL